MMRNAEADQHKLLKIKVYNTQMRAATLTNISPNPEIYSFFALAWSGTGGLLCILAIGQFRSFPSTQDAWAVTRLFG